MPDSGSASGLYWCGRCDTELSSGHISYHCRGCTDYDICIICARRGIYCVDDGHSWVEQRFRNDGSVLRSSNILTPGRLRGSLLEGSFPKQAYPTPSWPDASAIVFEERSHRFINRQNAREIFIFTAGEGSEFFNGAGCAFVFGPKQYVRPCPCSHGILGDEIFGSHLRGFSSRTIWNICQDLILICL